MIRPFAVADILLVYHLESGGVPLAIEHTLTHPRPPLWLALASPLPWLGRGGATYVLRERDHNRSRAGFVQFLKRAARPEADLLHLAPAHGAIVPADAEADGIWRRLLAFGCSQAAQRGIQRIYASVPDGGREMACMRDAGFSLYTRETIYRLTTMPPASSAAAGFRRQFPRDSWTLQRLYARGTPCLVQQAEGALTRDAGAPPLAWWEPQRWHGIVWAPAGEVRGAVQIHAGRAGHWLRVWGASALTARETRAIIEQGLQMLAALPAARRRHALPVYATVRDYEIGLGGVLGALGFAPYTDRARFVKHTVAARRVALPAALPALEVRHEVPVRSQGQPQVWPAGQANSSRG